MKAPAYAKINRSLSVTGVRADGYHTLSTVMQSVSLCDIVTVERIDAACASGSVEFSCTVPELQGERNLCVRSANAFFAAVPAALASGGVRILLDKRIPTGAGLGGGSADAATVLRLLHALYRNALSEDALYALAATLGADVPFCLHGGMCLCTGIGEELTVLPDEPVRPLVIAKGQSGLSTPDMYRRLDCFLKEHPGTAESYANWFEPVAERVLPDVAALKLLLTEQGANGVQMTGSGSAVFGWLETDAQAEAVAAMVRAAGYFAVAARTVSAQENQRISV